jgi:hypothetical protein
MRTLIGFGFGRPPMKVYSLTFFFASLVEPRPLLERQQHRALHTITEVDAHLPGAGREALRRQVEDVLAVGRVVAEQVARGC